MNNHSLSLISHCEEDSFVKKKRRKEVNMSWYLCNIYSRTINTLAQIIYSDIIQCFNIVIKWEIIWEIYFWFLSTLGEQLNTNAASYCRICNQLYPDKRFKRHPFDQQPWGGVTTLQTFLTSNMKVKYVIIQFLPENNETIIYNIKFIIYVYEQ